MIALPKVLASVAAAIAAMSALADATPKPADGKSKSVDFAVACSNAWLKCTTGKPAVEYEPGEDIKFTFSLMGVTNDIPKAKYKWKWTRRVAGGAAESGTGELEKKPFEYTTKLEEPGFVRLDIEIVTADGKPFEKVSGKTKTPLRLSCGAGVAPRKLEPPPLPKDFAKGVADIKKQMPRVSPAQYKKIAREAVEVQGLKVAKVFAVSVPCTEGRPATGYLTIPEGASGGTKYPCLLELVECGSAAKQPLPVARQIPADEMVFLLAFDPGKKDARDEAFYTDLFLHVVRALQYIKSLPEWNGRDLAVHGRGPGAALAIWAAGCGEGVTKATCSLFERFKSEMLDPVLFARLVPGHCLVDNQFAGLGDDERPPADVAMLWNALSCDKRLLWSLGTAGWNRYRGRDELWEKVRPVTYRNLDAKHCKDIRGTQGPYFTDTAVALRDKVVVEAIVDYEKPKTFQPDAFGTLRSYGQRDLKPIEVYAVLPVKKAKDKQWESFLVASLGEKGKGGNFQFPFYLDAGMDLPPPPSIPWFHVVDINGILRYSGASQDEATTMARNLYGALPPADPLFAYAKPEILKDEIDKLVKAKTPGPKIYKAIEVIMKRSAGSDRARAEEAEHLLIGMRQANIFRLQAISKLYSERAGSAYNELTAYTKEWPTLDATSTVKWLRASATKNPDILKLAKLEAELQRLNAWKPTRPSDIRKRDAEMNALRAKVARFAESKDTQIQGEALLMQADIENPPEEPEQ